MESTNPWTNESRNDEDVSRGHEHLLQCTTKILSFSSSCSSPIFRESFSFVSLCNVSIARVLDNAM